MLSVSVSPKQKLEEKLEYWMEKYEKDTESKQQELNTLKASKANDLAALQELAKQVRDQQPSEGFSEPAFHCPGSTPKAGAWALPHLTLFIHSEQGKRI